MSKPDTIRYHPKQLDDLRLKFPVLEITPNSTMQDVYYNAGIQSVLRYVASKCSTDTGLNTLGRVQTGDS